MVDTAILRDQLKALAGEVADKYHPLPFREIMNIVEEVPPWATQGEYVKIQVSSEMKLATTFDNTVPLASHKRTSRFFNVYEFLNGFEIHRKEQLRAAQDPSYQLDSTLSAANQRRAEQTQSELLMKGTFQGVALTGVNGLLKMTDASNVTVAAGSPTTWVDAAGVIVVTDFNTILNVFDSALNEYRTVAGEEVLPDFCGVANHQWKALVARSAASDARVIDILRDNYPDTQFMPLREADEIDGAGLDRLTIWSKDEDVQKGVIPEEYTDLDESTGPTGTILVPSTMSSGGCISNYPTGIAYVTQDRADTP